MALVLISPFPKTSGQNSIPLIESGVSFYLSGDFDSCLFELLDYYSTNDLLTNKERLSLLSRASLIAAWYGNKQIADITSIDADSLEGAGIVPDSIAKADKFFLQAIREYDKSDLTKAAELLLHSAQLRNVSNKFERAILADTYGFHGWVYKSLNDYAKAIGYYTKAIAIDRELNRTSIMASELTELASTRMAFEPNDQRIDSELEEALGIYIKDSNYPYLAVVYNEYGALYRNRGNLPLALNYL